MKPLINTVLVVDDSPDSLSLINDTLEQSGMNTLVALDGKQALAIARQLRPDMILLDALMPNMDGFETCRALKADPRLSSIPVIFMTGLTDTDSMLKGLEMGGVDYLTKPVNPDELLARMKVHLNNARMTHSAQHALDTTGQNMFTVNSAGQIVWATPQAHALFARTNVSEQWRQEVLAEALEHWLQHNPKPGQILPIDTVACPLEISLVDFTDQGEALLKVAEEQKLPGEERLRKALHLTVRESEVLFWLANGKANKEIAEILGIGVRTVDKHLEQVFPKLGVENRTSAAGIAIRLLN